METKNKFSTWVKNQQVTDQRYKQNKEKILKFTNSIEMSDGLKLWKSLTVANDEQLDKAILTLPK